MRPFNIVISVCLFLQSTSFALAQQKINIAVAASLHAPLQEVATLFEKKHHIKVEISAASSGTLTNQIVNGAPFQVFIAADMDYPEQLYLKGYGKGKPVALCHGTLVFWSKQKISENEIYDYLVGSTVKTISIAQPDLAPYGKAAEEYLRKSKKYEQIKRKLVFGESIGKVNQYIHSLSVDAAFTSNSAMFSNKIARGYWLHLVQEDAIPQGILILKKSGVEAKALYDFLLSEAAQLVFSKFGYKTANFHEKL